MNQIFFNQWTATEPAELTAPGDEPYRPTGWAVPFDISTDLLAFRDPDGSAYEAAARAGTKLLGSYYFDIGLFVSGGVKFVATFADNAGVINIGSRFEGGYFLPVLDRLGFEFFASIDLGCLLINGNDPDDAARPVEITDFSAGAGVGARALIPLVENPIKSNFPSLTIGVEYSRTLTSDHIPPDLLIFSTGTLFDFV